MTQITENTPVEEIIGRRLRWNTADMGSGVAVAVDAIGPYVILDVAGQRVGFAYPELEALAR